VLIRLFVTCIWVYESPFFQVSSDPRCASLPWPFSAPVLFFKVSFSWPFSAPVLFFKLSLIDPSRLLSSSLKCPFFYPSRLLYPFFKVSLPWPFSSSVLFFKALLLYPFAQTGQLAFLGGFLPSVGTMKLPASSGLVACALVLMWPLFGSCHPAQTPQQPPQQLLQPRLLFLEQFRRHSVGFNWSNASCSFCKGIFSILDVILLVKLEHVSYPGC